MKNLKIAAASIAVCASMLFTACGAGEKVEFVHSTFDSNGKYTCEMLGVGADFDTAEWTPYSDSQIASANGASSASSSDMQAVLDKNAMVQDMMVTMESGTNINLVYEDTNQTIAGNVSESAYIDMSMDQLEDQLADVMDNIKSNKTNVTFAGQSRPVLDVTGEVYDTTLYERLIPIRNGNYMGMFTISALSQEEIDEITAMFYALS